MPVLVEEGWTAGTVLAILVVKRLAGIIGIFAWWVEGKAMVTTRECVLREYAILNRTSCIVRFLPKVS